MSITRLRRLALGCALALVLLILLFPLPAQDGQAQVQPTFQGTILMYHHLVPAAECPAGSKNARNNAIVTVEQFEAQMSALAAAGVTTYLMSDLLPALQAGKLAPKSVVITFDDGYASNYTYAYPILRKYGLKANIAAIVRATEQAGTAIERTEERIAHLSLGQIREMAASGIIEFGSHTYDLHYRVAVNENGRKMPATIARIYNKASKTTESNAEYRERLVEDLIKSKYLLEQITQQPIIYFAYPYGYRNDELQATVAAVGYKIATTTHPDFFTPTQDWLALPRVNVGQNMTADDVMRIINGELPKKPATPTHGHGTARPACPAL